MATLVETLGGNWSSASQSVHISFYGLYLVKLLDWSFEIKHSWLAIGDRNGRGCVKVIVGS